MPAATSTPFDADVLVVGTGPMGATTALTLATYGLRVIALSRQNWLADSPRAHVTNLRTMEVLRSLGLEEEAMARATPWELMGDTTFTTSLAGREIARLASFGLGDRRYGEYLAASPCRMADLPQPLLEPLLVGAAATRGAVFSFNTLYRCSSQDADGVDVELEDRLTGQVQTKRVRYLVGADGARSKVMEDAGLSVEGQLRRGGTVYAQFDGDLSRHMAHRSSVLTWIVNDDAAVGEIGLGLLRAVRPWDQWIAGWGFDPDAGEPDLSLDTARARIRAYVGDPEFEPDITAVNPWYVNEAFAPAYSRGRVFCGGDAVHRHPPSNGLGSNTSIQDSFNLAWKLAYVIRGHAAETLLDSYSAERAPVGEQVVRRANQSRREYAGLHSALAAERPGGPSGAAKLCAATPEGSRARAALAEVLALKDNEYNALGVELNQRYSSHAVVPDSEVPEEFLRDREIHAQHTTRPGAKLPHAWLVDREGRRLSTLDLVGEGDFTLLIGPTGRPWVEAVTSLGLPYLKAVVVGGEDAQDLYFDWARAREVDEDGAVLVRPDGYVAWRSRTAEPVARDRLAGALTRVLGRPVAN
ncbi:FAD-dependent monooxygenase [Phytoactinopolyspora endophytica]|uniref:FAD-dependent monooxygenase n=1 Tax=Phytoactinopolyspora endophytica TaxID=1642495 RepID=UPI00101DAAED|nr:FAD-dependent monooxygenase [Phytoactinopolyspora endophytica]